MGRPIKTGLDYFSHDCDAMSDEKIESLTLLYGAKGYMFYFGILERIYRTQNQELDISAAETISILAKKLCLTEIEFFDILNTSINIGCFDKKMYEKKILTSAGIKERARPCLFKRGKMRFSYAQEVSAAETHQKPPVSEAETCRRVKKRREEKSKVKIIYNNNKYENISSEDLKNWSNAYPAVDIELSIKQSIEWLKSNPTQVKSNIRRFLTNWFARTQEKGGNKNAQRATGCYRPNIQKEGSQSPTISRNISSQTSEFGKTFEV